MTLSVGYFAPDAGDPCAKGKVAEIAHLRVGRVLKFIYFVPGMCSDEHFSGFFPHAQDAFRQAITRWPLPRFRNTREDCQSFGKWAATAPKVRGFAIP